MVEHYTVYSTQYTVCIVHSIVPELDKVVAIIAVVCDESPGVVSYFLTICSLLLVLVTLPFSLLYTVKVVQVNTGFIKAEQLIKPLQRLLRVLE